MCVAASAVDYEVLKGVGPNTDIRCVREREREAEREREKKKERESARARGRQQNPNVRERG